MRRYIERVSGNVKGGCDTTIGRLTLLYGPNGAGKSRVVNTLELATSGEASDIVGREKVRRGSDLITLAPEEENLTATAYTDDGVVCSFSIERNGPGKTRDPVSTPLPSGYSVIFPIRDVVTALRGQVGTARTFVLQHSGLDVSQEAVVSRFPELMRPLYTTFLANYAHLTSPVEQLILIREDAKKTASAAKSKAKQAEQITEELSRQLSLTCPTDEEREKAQARVREANRVYNDACKLPEPPDLAVLFEQAKEAIEKSDAAEKEVDRLREIANVPENRILNLQGALYTILGLYVEQGGVGPCVVCQQNVETTVPALEGRRRKIEDAAQTERQRQEAVSALVRQEAVYQNRHALALNAIKAYKDAEAKQVEGFVSKEDKQTKIREAYLALTEAEKVHREMSEEVGKWKKVQEARQQQIIAKREAKEAAELSEECQKVADQLINAGRAGFVARVQKYLPSSDNFDLILQEGKREVCIFGFRRGTMIQSALSGAEWARLTIALAAAVLDAAPPTENSIAILTPEERAFDARTLAAVMRALVHAPGQVILTSPVAPRKEEQPELIAAGWKILKIGKKGEKDE
jgi:energy-coupling factor transporter ATP-binding protein EcfA2